MISLIQFFQHHFRMSFYYRDLNPLRNLNCMHKVFPVFLHVFGVLVESVIHRENLIKAMRNGEKTPG